MSGVPVLHRSSMLNIAHLELEAKNLEKNFLLHLEKRLIMLQQLSNYSFEIS